MKLNIISKFKFREIVVVSTADDEKKEINGKRGYVGGMSYDDPDEQNRGNVICHSYGVFIFDLDEVWSVDEGEMKSTGEFVPENYGKSDLTIRVSQKGEFLGIIEEKDKKDS